MNIKARIRRNKFDELAGKFYRDENSQLVKDLNKNNKKALLGIQNINGVYTIVGEEKVYYSDSLGNESEINLTEFLEILKNNALKLGKKGDFEFININDQNSVWVLNGQTMNAMWNTVMLLNNNK